MNLRQIGVVVSNVNSSKEMPPLGGPARIDVFADFEPALLHIAEHSHLWVFGWLDRGERDTLQVIPRGGSELHGVFAVRSPARPNPIGLTACRVTSIEGLSIHVDRLDFLNNTAVLDLKPYLVTRDMIFSARNEHLGKPVNATAARDSLLIQAAGFHGEECEDVRLAVDMASSFPGAQMVIAPLHRPHLVDALTGIFRVSLGRGTLRLHNQDWVSLTRNGETRRFELDSRGSPGIG